MSLTSQSWAEKIFFFLKIVSTGTIYRSKDSCHRSSDSIFWNAAQLAFLSDRAALLAGSLVSQWEEVARSEFCLFVLYVFIPRLAGHECFHGFLLIKHQLLDSISKINAAWNGSVAFWNTEVLRKAGWVDAYVLEPQQHESWLPKRTFTKWEMIESHRCWDQGIYIFLVQLAIWNEI